MNLLSIQNLQTAKGKRCMLSALKVYFETDDRKSWQMIEDLKSKTCLISNLKLRAELTSLSTEEYLDVKLDAVKMDIVKSDEESKLGHFNNDSHQPSGNASAVKMEESASLLLPEEGQNAGAAKAKFMQRMFVNFGMQERIGMFD